MTNTIDEMKSRIGQATLNLDSELSSLVSGVNIIEAVNPINLEVEKQAFFTNRYNYEPSFSYMEHGVDSFLLKRKLFNLPVDQVADADLQTLYMKVIESYVDKIDQFKSIGSQEFLYASLRYFGEPTEKDIRNALFLLHLPTQDDASSDLWKAEQVSAYLSNFSQQNGYEHSIKIQSGMIANALVSGTTVKVNQQVSIEELEVKALAHHELGVHLLTTLNARAQPLKLLSVGMPLNTLTQEGLAILCEYLSGCLSVKRLRKLALRVIAVSSMIQERSFKRTFSQLKDEYHISDEDAFTITTRVYRGGGFTKDYVYLQGLHRMLTAYESEKHFNLLLAGKTSIDYLPMLSRLIDKGLLIAPDRVSPALDLKLPIDPVQKFIAHAIK